MISTKGSGAFYAFAYLALTLVMTWPLALGLTRDVPGDLGDSLLNLWILGWGVEHVPRLATGQMSLPDFWNANIFHPEPLALSFSEHLFGQVLQILPVYHLTGNLILSYNLLFVSSFVLSGLAMYLLVRELLGHGPGMTAAALVAGLIYAFVPFRIAQVAHIQSLSSQWMPLALYGFVRFIRTDRLRSLVGGTAALLMQNWSCGYYLVYFAPFVAVFVPHQIVASGRTRDWRVWISFAAAALVVVAGTWPFLSLYLEAQRVHGFERPISEVIRYSADVYSYFTAPEALRLWGDVIRMHPKPEGELFFGVVPMLLVVAAMAWAGLTATSHAVRPPGRRSTLPTPPPPRAQDPPRATARPRQSLSLAPGARQAAAGNSQPPTPNRKAAESDRGGRRWAERILIVIVVIQLAGLIGNILTGGFVTSFAGIPIRATNSARMVTGIGIVLAVLAVVSARARQRLRAAIQSPLTLAVVLALLALWLSLGPMPQSRGRTLQGLGLYGVFYDHVPGFSGLRSPARYAMVAAVFLSIVAGYGAAAIMRRVRRPGLVAAAMGGVFLIEVAFLPMPINLTWSEGRAALPPRVEVASRAPAVYRHLGTMPDARVITEFPFGDPERELRYAYYSTVHWKRLVNGYSGFFPQRYNVRVARFARVASDPEGAWQALRETGTTHVIVHEDAYASGEADEVKRWLTDHAAREIARFDADVLFAIPDL
jgi:hypothetical protein